MAQISRNVYRFPVPPEAKTKAQQLVTSYSAEKYKQWKLSIEQSKALYTNIEDSNAAAVKAAANARLSLSKQIATLNQAIADLREGGIKAQDAVNKTNEANKIDYNEHVSTNKRQVDTANAGIESREAIGDANRGQQAEIAGKRLQLDAIKVRRAKAKTNIRGRSSAKEEVQAALVAANGDPIVAWDALKREREKGVSTSGGDSADDYAFMLVDSYLADQVDEATSRIGRELTEAEESEWILDSREDLPIDALVRHDKTIDEEEGKAGTGAGGVDTDVNTHYSKKNGRIIAPTTPPPGKLELDAVARKALLDGQIADRDALINQRNNTTANVQDLPDIIRNAQRTQYEHFGPTGFGRREPGFAQQERFTKLGTDLTAGIDTEIAMLGDDATDEDIAAARTRGIDAVKAAYGYVPEVVNPDLDAVYTPEEEAEFQAADEAALDSLPEKPLTGLDEDKLDSLPEEGEESEVEEVEPVKPEDVPPTEKQKRAKRISEIRVKATKDFGDIGNDQKKIKELHEADTSEGKIARIAWAMYEAGSSSGYPFDDTFKDIELFYKDDPENKEVALKYLILWDMIDASTKEL